jgi:hypothetical protein
MCPVDTPTFSLIRLPKSFVELYGIVNKVKGRDEGSALDDTDDVGNSETAICLLTGAVMRSGSARRPFHRSVSTCCERFNNNARFTRLNCLFVL